MKTPPIHIEIEGAPGGRLALGKALDVQAHFAHDPARDAPDQDTEYAVYLEHESTLYQQPIHGWSRAERFEYFPEAPGAYALRVRWRRGDAAGSLEPVPFVVTVDPPVQSDGGPVLVKLDRGQEILAPSAWETAQASAYEEATVAALRRILRPSHVIYDVGTSMGFHTLWMSRILRTGWIYCIEANPINVYLLRANLSRNQVRRVTVIPTAISSSAGEVEFKINYSNLAIGVSSDSPFFGIKAGHSIRVEARSLDELIDHHRLRPPDLVKIDIEGAEGLALEGMAETLATHRPTVAIEIHGEPAAHACLEQLRRHRYEARDLQSGQTFRTVEEVLAWYPGGVQFFVCTPRSAD